MAWEWRRRIGALTLAGLVGTVGACGDGAASQARPPERALVSASTSTSTSTTTTALPATLPPVTAAPAPPTTPPTPTTRPHPVRVVHPQAWIPYATVGPVTLHHPSDRVEAIGFHQSGHDGAQEQTALAGAAHWFTMEDRDRDTTRRGAADIVVEPDRELRAPVTGVVVRAGTYTLYCDHVDQYVVIEPDGRPGWEVKVLHVEGLALTKGQRVEAGLTRLAAKARVLPFPSQVEEDTGLPPWPHVHLEVVDPTVPDRPTGPGCP
jgi:murein DD-endopeptidase MepM/ murein hydrolase activator NlpD